MKFQSSPDESIVPSLNPGARATTGGLSPEHGIHDGGEIESTKPGSTETTCSPCAAATERITALVVDGSFVGVIEHLVGLAEFFELLGCILALRHVGMHLHGLATIGLLNLFCRSILVDSEDVVVVLAQCSAFCEDTTHVSRNGAYGCDGGGIVHAGRTDHPK